MIIGILAHKYGSERWRLPPTRLARLRALASSPFQGEENKTLSTVPLSKRGSRVSTHLPLVGRSNRRSACARRFGWGARCANSYSSFRSLRSHIHRRTDRVQQGAQILLAQRIPISSCPILPLRRGQRHQRLDIGLADRLGRFAHLLGAAHAMLQRARDEIARELLPIADRQQIG